jgi:hypothetical protein
MAMAATRIANRLAQPFPAAAPVAVGSRSVIVAVSYVLLGARDSDLTMELLSLPVIVRVVFVAEVAVDVESELEPKNSAELTEPIPGEGWLCVDDSEEKAVDIIVSFSVISTNEIAVVIA